MEIIIIWAIFIIIVIMNMNKAKKMQRGAHAGTPA